MSEPRWRVGRKLGRTLYLDGHCVGLVDTPEMAAALVSAINGGPTCRICGDPIQPQSPTPDVTKGEPTP